MRVQIQGQEVRFRIDEAELATLLDGREVVNNTWFGPHAGVVQRLGTYAAAVPSFEAMHDQWHLLLPESALRAHAGRLPCKDGLMFELERGGGLAMTIRFDVDVRDSARMRRRSRTHPA